MGRGRPKGHRLSEKSKKKISDAKRGVGRSFETREKISAGVKRYFDEIYTDKMFANYRMCDPIFEWLKDYMGVNFRGDKGHYLEDTFGSTIDLFPYELTPEKLMIIKDLLEKLPKHSPILRKLLDRTLDK